MQLTAAIVIAGITTTISPNSRNYLSMRVAAAQLQSSPELAVTLCRLCQNRPLKALASILLLPLCCK